MRDAILPILLSGLFGFAPAVARELRIDPTMSASDIKQTFDRLLPGDTLRLATGNYPAPLPRFTHSGNATHPIHILGEPGGASVRLPGWKIDANYLEIRGIDFRGEAERIDYREAIKSWWHPDPRIRRRGVVIRGHHILFEENTVCYFPGSGARFVGDSDYLTIRHNVICNNAWWSTGGTGGLIVKNIRQFDDNKSAKIRIEENLFFGNESRIISHVFKKGFVTLTIDEGESLLLQQKEDPHNPDAKSGHYEGSYRVAGNLILYNGKGSSFNKVRQVTFVGNDLYGNGTTAVNPGAAGIRGNRTAHDLFVDNAVGVAPDKKPIDVVGKDLLFRNDYATKTPLAVPIQGVHYVTKLFADPRSLDFSTPWFGPRANRLLKRLKPLLRRAGLRVRPTGYKVDLKAQIATILQEARALGATIRKNRCGYEVSGLHVSGKKEPLFLRTPRKGCPKTLRELRENASSFQIGPASTP